jgi:hypothetical protein
MKWKQTPLPVTRIADAIHILKVLIGDQNTRPPCTCLQPLGVKLSINKVS